MINVSPIKKYPLHPLNSILLLTCLFSSAAYSSVIDKIYHPYVDALEQEIEYRLIVQANQPGEPDDVALHQLSYGRSFGDKWFSEIYLIGEKSDVQSFEIEAYEIETKWQLTEQGEFWADLGLLFELEKADGESIWELSTALLVEKELGKWSGTTNLFITQEFGRDIDEELEATFGSQIRYRYSRYLEPAIEFYSGEDVNALGPVLQGNLIVGTRRTLHWESGIIFSLDGYSPNRTLRFLLEYEF